MTQLAVRIGSILLICVAATPVSGGPRGAAHFGGGGVHFGGGGGTFAPPHIAAPRAPLTSPVAPQLSARPGHVSSLMRNPTEGGHGFRRKADSNPIIADSG
jgi:hypothetical protein